MYCSGTRRTRFRANTFTPCRRQRANDCRKRARYAFIRDVLTPSATPRIARRTQLARDGSPPEKLINDPLFLLTRRDDGAPRNERHSHPVVGGHGLRFTTRPPTLKQGGTSNPHPQSTFPASAPCAPRRE